MVFCFKCFFKVEESLWENCRINGMLFFFFILEKRFFIIRVVSEDKLRIFRNFGEIVWRSEMIFFIVFKVSLRLCIVCGEYILFGFCKVWFVFVSFCIFFLYCIKKLFIFCNVLMVFWGGILGIWFCDLLCWCILNIFKNVFNFLRYVNKLVGLVIIFIILVVEL